MRAPMREQPTHAWNTSNSLWGSLRAEHVSVMWDELLCMSVYVCACFRGKENHKDVCSKHTNHKSFSFADFDCPNTGQFPHWPYSKQLVFQCSNRLNVVVLGCLKTCMFNQSLAAPLNQFDAIPNSFCIFITTDSTWLQGTVCFTLWQMKSKNMCFLMKIGIHHLSG